MKNIVPFIFLFIVACNNVHVEPSTENQVSEIKIEPKKMWYQPFWSGQKNSTKDLEVGSLENLDKMNGFRDAKFNTVLSEYDFNIPGTEVDTCANYSRVDMLFLNDGEFNLSDGRITRIDLEFLDEKLKIINLLYEEIIGNSSDKKMIYENLDIFNFLVTSFGEPEKIECDCDYKLPNFSDSSLISAIIESDNYEEAYFYAYWRTNKIELKLHFNKMPRTVLDDVIDGKNSTVFAKIELKFSLIENNMLENLKIAKANCSDLETKKSEEIKIQKDNQKLKEL